MNGSGASKKLTAGRGPRPFPQERQRGTETKWSLDELNVQLRRIALQQSAVDAVLPIVTFVNVYHADGRLWSVSLVSWVVAALLGAFGYCAAEARSSTLVTAYVCFGVLGGGALAAVQVAVDWTMSAACEVTQSAYKGCHDCQCSFTDSCSQDDLDNDEGCDDCKAFSTDICDALGFESSGADRLVNGFTALVTLLASCVPVGVAILLLIRKEQEDATVAARFSWIKGQILDQCMLLESGYKPTIDGYRCCASYARARSTTRRSQSGPRAS